ncbi:sodium:proton antiporter [Nocardioides humilatus]|uniref:Sodium:proton antiporter n=1 Tax=Nocardioides humilatus TaxID=2607660 RepID=A0A5B1LGG3_9ACTN|nr:DUF6328 family protein [Nocardioides humilatus]KAA1419268.1 sodium:proton antiporter [Nocardioides humilatus]
MTATHVRRSAATTGPSPRSKQLDRNWDELLQELRVMQTGVQILTGFLLTVPFTDRFADLDHAQRTIYLCVLTGSVVTTCLIVAPAAFHRVLFHQRERHWLVSAANISARVGLTCLAVVSSGVVLLVFDIVLGTTGGIVASLAVLTMYFTLWLGVPLIARVR